LKIAVIKGTQARRVPLFVSLLPIIVLLSSLVLIMMCEGADAIAGYSPVVLLGSAALSVVLSFVFGALSRRGMTVGFVRSARQILPAVPMLICIAMVATTWMVSGVVPTLIVYGLEVLTPTLFLVSACVVCALISVLTGSSWSTIATIGVAFMGIGQVMGFSAGWIAGAIISGAYFGDKISPLSDTTVVASSACGVDLFAHMRYLMLSSVPALLLALVVFAVKGFMSDAADADQGMMLDGALRTTFNITSWTLVIPAITLALIAFRVPTLLTLAASALLGFVGIFVFQPDLGHSVISAAGMLWSGNAMDTGVERLDSLVSTGGISGMMSTVALVLSAMMFGAAMMGTGMLASITRSFTSRLHKRTSIVGATVGSGLFMNSTTADQYLSLIITGNMYRNVYRQFGLEPRLLSRTIEDSVSVTSVLIPWNSCGITQSTVLGVSTMVYFPYCIFNLLSPCMSLLLAWTGWRIRNLRLSHAGA
jgi:Na+/H+ antiporter